MADIQTYPTVKRQISLPNDIETIPQLNEFIDTVAEEIGLDMPLTMSLNLALEEAVVNVMEMEFLSTLLNRLKPTLHCLSRSVP